MRAGREPGHRIHGLHREMSEKYRRCPEEARQAACGDQHARPHCAAPTAENKETVNSPEMSLEEEGSDQVAKVFFNAKGLIILGLSE